jgi:hypothetical protein
MMIRASPGSHTAADQAGDDVSAEALRHFDRTIPLTPKINPVPGLKRFQNQTGVSMVPAVIFFRN